MMAIQSFQLFGESIGSPSNAAVDLPISDCGSTLCGFMSENRGCIESIAIDCDHELLKTFLSERIN